MCPKGRVSRPLAFPSSTTPPLLCLVNPRLDLPALPHTPHPTPTLPSGPTQALGLDSDAVLDRLTDADIAELAVEIGKTSEEARFSGGAESTKALNTMLGDNDTDKFVHDHRVATIFKVGGWFGG